MDISGYQHRRGAFARSGYNRCRTFKASQKPLKLAADFSLGFRARLTAVGGVAHDCPWNAQRLSAGGVRP